MARRFIPAIATQSVGRAWHHKLEDKLAVCAQYGFEAIEIFYEDLEGVARSLPSSHTPASAGTSFDGSTSWQEQQITAAQYIHQLCLHLRLEILCLQPFMHYEGLLDSQRHQQRVTDLKFWFSLARHLRTDLIQIPSNFLPASECTSDRQQIIADLKEVADLGLQQQPPIRFAYEALCWGTHIDLWDDAWNIVRAVDRPNFGTCLDTFNLAGRVYADPADPSGKTPRAEEDIRESIRKLRSELDASKIFYVEVVDGERLEQPITPEHPWYVAGQKARMTWSRNARLFPFEERGYLPVLEVLEAICESGYTGYISFELFSRTANMPQPSVPEDHARRGQLSWLKLVDHMKWNKTVKENPNGKMTPQVSTLSTSPAFYRIQSSSQQSVPPLLQAH